ncbi:hypothetical protein HDU87_006583 [Geranomyces variabilis]|uniref:Adenosine deaminase domain-containing protein n=1 Tax=Geranomyces variabilis TaxID=109894 RepID=A0AAD5XNA0_9FUNG|nr:hypothetical protein HDU87_006583 [Geranomyces variabilis]
MKAPTVPNTSFVDKEFGGVDQLLEYCKALPKIELHAHLNGSISPESLRQLAEKRLAGTVGEAEAATGALSVLEALEWKDTFDLKDFFPMFKHIYALTNNMAWLVFIVHGVIKDFEDDGVRYLELRSTPRDDASTGLTKELYVQTVLQAISTSPATKISTRLILTIDRRHSPEVAMQIVDLAIRFRDQGVVGVDLAGDPYAADFDCKHALLKAKAAGLKVTIHLGEIENREAESASMLEVRPDRLGHATFLSEQLRAHVYEERIAVEMCMTSNVLCRTVSSYEEHHIKEALELDHPSILCTDDKSIFASPLSCEYALAASTFSMTKQQLFDLSKKSIDAIFANSEEKTRLRGVWDTWAP